MSRRDEDAGALSAYLRGIGKRPRLTVVEERELGRRIQLHGDRAALTRLVEANLLFVVSYAKRYRDLEVSFLDQTRAFSFPPKLFSALGRVHGASPDVSLSEPVTSRGHDGPSRELGDLLAQHGTQLVEEEMIHQVDLKELAAALRDLDGKEREIVRLRFGLEDEEPRTLQEIGDRLHLSRERVRQIESRAKEKLRHSARLRSYLN